MMEFPSLFVSHGAPTLILEDAPSREFLSGLGEAIGRPTAIVAATAHWETKTPALGAAAAPETIHDFYGFPEPLYQIQYPAAGAPEVARRASELLAEAGVASSLAADRGLDHGVWAPLALMYPAADIPVVPLSVQPSADPAAHLAVGEALRPLRRDGVLIIGSGSATHNLMEWRGAALESPAPAWVTSFADWVADRIDADDRASLLAYRDRAPNAVRNHPTEEHFLPLFTAMGAGGAGGSERLHQSSTYGVLAMDAYAFH